MSNVAKIEQPQVLAVVPADEATALISMIERAARDPNVDVDKFERLMAMRERVDRINAEKAFNAAISAARAEIPPIIKGREVDFTSSKGRTKYRHEDFAGIARVVDPILAKYGLSYRHRSAQQGGKLSVTCIVSHSDGHSETTTLEASEDHSGNKNSIQAIGSSATYLQRYTLKLALGISTSSDDDGKASGASAGGIITPEQVDEIKRLIADSNADLGWICERYSIETLADMTSKQYGEAKAGLTARLKQQKAKPNG